MKKLIFIIFVLFLFDKSFILAQQIKDIEPKKVAPKVAQAPKKEPRKIQPKRIYSVDKSTLEKNNLEVDEIIAQAEKKTEEGEYQRSNETLDKLPAKKINTLEVLVLRLNNHENLAVQYAEKKFYSLERNEIKKLIEYLGKMNSLYEEDKELEIAECQSDIAKSYIKEYIDSNFSEKLKAPLTTEALVSINKAIPQNANFKNIRAEIYYLIGNYEKANIDILEIGKNNKEPETLLMNELIAYKLKTKPLSKIVFSDQEKSKIELANKSYLLTEYQSVINKSVSIAEGNKKFLTLGIEYFYKGDFDNSLKYLNDALIKGNAQAANYFIGTIYFHSDASETKKIESKSRYQMAQKYFEQDIMANGTKKSNQYLGYIWEKGLANQPNMSKAKEYYKTSCEAGLKEGCISLKRINI